MTIFFKPICIKLIWKTAILWTMRLNEYDFDVLPKAGEENGYGDSLSRFQLCYLLFTYEEMNNFVINSKISSKLKEAT